MVSVGNTCYLSVVMSILQTLPFYEDLSLEPAATDTLISLLQHSISVSTSGDFVSIDNTNNPAL